MTVLKLVFGFVVGLMACAVLLGLISIRSPILANSESIATQKVTVAVSVIKPSGEQKVNIFKPTSAETSEAETINRDVDNLNTSTASEQPIIDKPIEAPVAENEVEDIAQAEPKAAEPQVLDTKPIQDEIAPTSPTVINQVPATVLKRAGTTLNLGSGSSRLPSVSSETTETTQAAVNDTLDTSIFTANSNPVVDLDTPFLSIILLDVGTAGVSQADLLKQTLPLSFAVDGSRTDAARVAGDYRDAGFEVVTMLNADHIATITTPDAAESAVLDYVAAIPSALAIVDAPNARLQKNRRLLAPVLASLADSAPGFLTYKGGLSSAATATRDAGLQSGMITRYLDETSQSPSIVKRAIDRTTIDAAKDGAAILMAVATPAVLQGIAQWADSNAASKVELVSVSSAMKRQNP